MNTALTVVNETQEMKPARRVKIWRERPITEDVIFKATDERGRSGWFLRVMVTGLYPRRVGPYRTKDQALEVLEDFLYKVHIDPLIDLENDTNVPQEIMVEGVPQLVASGAELSQGAV